MVYLGYNLDNVKLAQSQSPYGFVRLRAPFRIGNKTVFVDSHEIEILCAYYLILLCVLGIKEFGSLS